MEKVKEFAYVLIRKKLHDFFFHKDGQENAEQGGFEDVLLLVPLSFIFLGNMGMFAWLMFFAQVFEPGDAQNVAFLRGNAGWLRVHVVW